LSSSSAVPIAAIPPATIAAEAAFFATCLTFDRTPEDGFSFGFDRSNDLLGFVDLAVRDFVPERREEDLS